MDKFSKKGDTTKKTGKAQSSRQKAQQGGKKGGEGGGRKRSESKIAPAQKANRSRKPTQRERGYIYGKLLFSHRRKGKEKKSLFAHQKANTSQSHPRTQKTKGKKKPITCWKGRGGALLWVVESVFRGKKR